MRKLSNTEDELKKSVAYEEKACSLLQIDVYQNKTIGKRKIVTHL